MAVNYVMEDVKEAMQLIITGSFYYLALVQMSCQVLPESMRMQD